MWLLFCFVFGAYGDFECIKFGFNGFFDGGGNVVGVGAEGFAERFDGGSLCGDCGRHVAYSFVDIADASEDIALGAVFGAAVISAA